MTESIFLNIITNGLYTSEHYIVAADSGGTLKSAYEENICYTESLYKIIKPKA
jgi:nickel-dependent lactate racemase